MTNTSTLRNSLMLAPLIGVSDTLVKAVGLWLMSILIIAIYGMTMKAIRSRLNPSLRLATNIVLAVTIVSCAGLALQVWALELHQNLGIYLGLIALQCVLLEIDDFFEHRLMADRLRLLGLFGALLIRRVYPVGTTDRRETGLDCLLKTSLTAFKETLYP